MCVFIIGLSYAMSYLIKRNGKNKGTYSKVTVTKNKDKAEKADWTFNNCYYVNLNYFLSYSFLSKLISKKYFRFILD